MKIKAICVLTLSSWVPSSILSAQVLLNQAPTRVVGKTTPVVVSASPNLAEAGGLYNPASVAVDNSSSPPILYVADFGNNRVLAWRNAAGFANGDPANLVLGQRDFLTTTSNGPGTQLSTGLSSPLAVAVDNQGNVYVADAGNNRILRYPKPFEQPDDFKIPDMIIGQANFSSNTPNGGTNAPANNTLALNSGGGRLFRTALTFDANGNLWFSDAGNNRVLRYPLSALQRNQNQPAADIVLGQFTFTTSAGTANNAQQNKQGLTEPAGLAFDSAGRLYICDALNRVLVYSRLVNGSQADRIMGVVVVPSGGTPPPATNETGFGRSVSGRNVPPIGVFTIGPIPFVVDSGNNRILRFDSFEAWPPEANSFSPPARQVIGQADFNSFRANRGQAEASNAGFDGPAQAVATPTEVHIVDAGNNRVLTFPIQGNTISTAARVTGQSAFHQTAPNNINGRELYLFAGFSTASRGVSSDGSGVVIDSRSNPPRLYVADTYNHRILGFQDARAVRQGDRADIVIGQSDFTRSQINSPTNDANQITDSGLLLPSGLAIDAGGNLFVADSGNGRVLRFPRPFEQTGPVRPDLVLGQASFFQKITDATARNLSRPYGLAFTLAGDLLVSDLLQNRVLFFRKPSGGDFSSGQAAEKVFGQPDFSSVLGSDFPNRMIAPHGIATDTDDRLYVADTGNNRVLIYDSVNVADFDPFPALPLANISSPHGIWVSPATGEIWVTSANQNAVFRFPVFLRLLIDPRSDYQIPAYAPTAVTQDPYGNLLIADGYNRVGLYYPGVAISNGGNQLRRFAPYTYATLKPVEGTNFGDTTIVASDLPEPTPLPTTLGDVQVLVNDVAAPVQSVAPNRIDFIIPQGTSNSNSVQIVVSRRSTGQVLASNNITVTSLAPALFTTNAEGTGQLLAKNPNGSLNDPNERVGRSETISLFGTGFGIPSGAPADGEAAPDKVPGVGILRVVMGTGIVPDENITYFGLAPGLVGIWQIDVKVPDSTAPDPLVPITCQFNSIPCNQGDGTGRIQRTTIAVKP